MFMNREAFAAPPVRSQSAATFAAECALEGFKEEPDPLRMSPGAKDEIESWLEMLTVPFWMGFNNQIGKSKCE